jgi:AhpD family alkylhydroperoxidase
MTEIESQKPTVEQVLKMMEQNLGEEPTPMVLMSKLYPEMVLRQAQERKFVFDMPNIPPKYKHLITIAVASAVSSHLCTETFIKLAKRCGATKEEIAEAIIVAKFALGSTVFASAVEGMEYLTKGDDANVKD